MIALLAILALLAVGGAVGGVGFGLGPTPCGSRVITIDSVEDDADTFGATFVGDTMLGDAAQPALDAHGYDWAFDQLEDVIETDFLMANAEGPITTRSDPYDAAQGWNYNAQPVAATALRTFGVDAISLANNHAMDRGPEGLADTIAAATAAGIQTVGADQSLCGAELPLLVKTPAGTLGIVALGMPYGRDRIASVTRPGSIAMNQTTINRGAVLARAAGADWVVAFVHWGQNYHGVTDEQRASAAQFAAAGYDLVIGAHPHIVQPVEVIDGMPVAYSLGNFVFGAAGRFPAGAGFGITVQTTFDATTGLQRLDLRCIATDNDVVAFQPRPCTVTEAQQLFATLGPELVVTGDRASLAIS
jgi:poly-gamma-glutamate capsule biosynthesis protein CapA/YwtB (metallophosphatase superfamily)